MTTLSDTLTPTVLTSEAGGVSIKVEQGVLYDNNEYEGRMFHTEKQHISEVKYEPNHPNNSEITSNSMGDSNYNMFNITRSIFQPDFEIKSEPSVDIDDRQPDEEAEEITSFQSQSPNENPEKPPKIRLTPTSKLIASTNGSTDNKRRYACPYENCTKSYGKSSHLRSHLTWHTGIKPFVCKEASCGKGFTRSDELNRHIRTHTGEKPFECVQCTKKFSRSDHLTKHLATHSKQLATNNGAMPKKIKVDKNLSQGFLKSTSTIEIVAVKDDQNTKVTNTIVSETKSNSPELITDRAEATQAGSLKMKLEQPEVNDDHIMRFPTQEIKFIPCQTLPVQQLEPSITKASNVLVKYEPLEESHASDSLEASRASEPDDDEVMPEANLPPLSPLIKQRLNQMSDSVYDPTRPFPCCRCTKSFKRQDDLNRHMRTHTGEKPFTCNECDKRFMRSDHLKKHMNTHTRVR